MSTDPTSSHRPRLFSRASKSFRGSMDLHETSEEKRRRAIKTKADPTLAITEDQPSTVAGSTSSNLESIRSIQHKDKDGNPIADPDKSNPTRSRWERPLDTIRSFEAAIDDRYPAAKAPDGFSGYNSRRSSQAFDGPIRPPMNGPHHGGSPYGGSQYGGSHYGGSQYGGPQYGGPQYGGPPYGGPQYGGPRYSGRPAPSRPDSYVDGYYHDQGPPPRPRYNQRLTPEPGMQGYNQGGPVYPNHGFRESYDTVTSGSGSGSHATDPWGNSTDPSSDNSSIERGQQLSKPDGEAYGFSGFGGAPQFPNAGNAEFDTSNGPANRQGYGQSPLAPSNGRYYEQGENTAPGPPVPPHLPPKDDTPPKPPVKLGGPVKPPPAPGGLPSSVKPQKGQRGPGLPSSVRPNAGEKRKSFFKRFSKG